MRPLGEQFFDFTKAEIEPKIEPDGVTGVFRWKPKAAIAWRFGIHHVTLPKPAQLDNTE